MKYYYAVFTIAYILSFFIFNFLVKVINIEISYAIATLIAGSFFTAWHFTDREQRCPSPKEKKLLIWGSIACSLVVISICLLLINIDSGTTSIFIQILVHIPGWIWLIAISFTVLIEWILFNFSYGWFAQKCFDLSNKKHLK